MTDDEYLLAVNLEKLQLAHQILQSVHPTTALNMDEVLSITCQLDVWIGEFRSQCQPHVDQVELREQSGPQLAVYKVKPAVDIDPQKLIEVDVDRFPGFGVEDDGEDDDEGWEDAEDIDPDPNIG